MRMRRYWILGTPFIRTWMWDSMEQILGTPVAPPGLDPKVYEQEPREQICKAGPWFRDGEVPLVTKVSEEEQDLMWTALSKDNGHPSSVGWMRKKDINNREILNVLSLGGQKKSRLQARAVGMKFREFSQTLQWNRWYRHVQIKRKVGWTKQPDQSTLLICLFLLLLLTLGYPRYCQVLPPFPKGTNTALSGRIFLKPVILNP